MAPPLLVVKAAVLEDPKVCRVTCIDWHCCGCFRVLWGVCFACCCVGGGGGPWWWCPLLVTVAVAVVVVYRLTRSSRCLPQGQRSLCNPLRTAVMCSFDRVVYMYCFSVGCLPDYDEQRMHLSCTTKKISLCEVVVCRWILQIRNQSAQRMRAVHRWTSTFGTHFTVPCSRSTFTGFSYRTPPEFVLCPTITSQIASTG